MTLECYYNERSSERYAEEKRSKSSRSQSSIGTKVQRYTRDNKASLCAGLPAVLTACPGAGLHQMIRKARKNLEKPLESKTSRRPATLNVPKESICGRLCPQQANLSHSGSTSALQITPRLRVFPSELRFVPSVKHA